MPALAMVVLEKLGVATEDEDTTHFSPEGTIVCFSALTDAE